jgi:hypothetical protein
MRSWIQWINGTHPSGSEKRLIIMPGRLGGLSAVLFSFILMTNHASAAPQDFQSGAGQVTLLELYTSEGCSSCPPAEAWLSRLKDSPDLWKSVVPVAFHVDYWDYLGWPDPWATKAFSDRQRAYAGAWGSDDIYTPGVVRNGREWKEWRGNNAPSEQAAAKPGVLHATSADGSEWKITFTPAEGVTGDFEVHAALLGSAMHSNVKAGENSGRQLVHDFVALALINAVMQKHEAVIKFSGDRSKDSGKLAVAIWVTHAGQIIPVQATGGWLSE